MTQQKAESWYTSALKCVSVSVLCFSRMVFMLSGELFFSPEQWLMWCPERHGFHIRKITVFCLLSASWPGSARGMNWRKKKTKKKNKSGFSHKHLQVCAAGFCPQEPKCVYETQVDAHRDMNYTHRHTHAYTVLSFSVTHTHTEAVKVTAFIFHCVTGDPKYLHCLAAAVPEDLGRGEQRAPITQRRSSTSSSEYVPCLFV